MRFRVALAAMLAASAAGAAVAHHSFSAEFDPDRPVKFMGKVTDQRLRARDLVVRSTGPCHEPQRQLVIECMIADPVAFIVRTHGKIAVMSKLPAEHEERRLDVAPTQRIEDVRCHVGLRPIVE